MNNVVSDTVYLPELGVDVSDTPRILPFKKAESCNLAIKR